jgi:hypothetical protein
VGKSDGLKRASSEGLLELVAKARYCIQADTSRKALRGHLPFITINETPLAPNIGPVEIHYREAGSGTTLVFLHGGWGYEVFPFDRYSGRSNAR